MAYFETVSPDGRHVAYAWWRKGASAGTDLRVVATDGSSDRVLREEWEIHPAAWSNDGRHIAVLVYPQGNSDTEIAWVSVQDGSKTTLATFQYDGRFHSRLSHSPDDRFLATEFPVEQDSARRDISLISTGGGKLIPLVKHPADDCLIGWTPGTNQVLFISDRSGNRDLWAVTVSQDGRPGEPRPVRRGIGEMSPMGFTRDGSLFYSNYTLQYNIFIAPFEENSGHVAVPEAKPLGGLGSNMRPSWSPDGRHLAFVRRRPSPPGRGFGGKGYEEIVHVLDPQTGEERALAEQIAPATVPPPTWFPDGRSLLVLGMSQTDSAAWDDKVPPAAYRVDLATGAAARLLALPPGSDWWYGRGLVATPDGDGVISVHDGRMVLHDLRSASEEVLYRDAALGTGLAFTPDGSELAFAAQTSDRPTSQQYAKKFMAMPARGGEARELVTIPEPGQAGIIGWTSDGRYLLLVVRDETGQAVARVPRAGGKLERLSPVQKNIRGLSASPDGRRIAYWTQENEAEIWVLENIKEALAGAR